MPADGELLVEMLELGVCGTDVEIVAGMYGTPPPGRDRLVLGHESLGRVRDAADGGGFAAGDLVAGIVRRPDPEPCACCARGEFDMCRNGRYRERGIKELDGYGAELVAVEREYAVKLDPSLASVGVLTEPTSVVVKAWEQVERIAEQACRPARAGAGHGRGADRPARRAARRPARAAGGPARPRARRPEAGAGEEPGRRLPHRLGPRRVRRVGARRGARVHRRAGARAGGDAGDGAGGDRLPDRDLAARADAERRRRRARRRARARERRRHGVRERQSPPFRGRRGGARRRGSRRGSSG